MKESDFECVRGFEPKVISPFCPLETATERQCDNSVFKIRAQLEYLDELMHELNEAQCTNETGSTDEPPTVPFVSRLRQYNRLPVPQKWTTAELRILGRKYPCQIVELSIGGFGIFLPRLLSLQPGTLGQLSAPDLNYIVSVTRIEAKDDGSFIGLKQIEEVIEDNSLHPNRGGAKIACLFAGIAGMLIAAISYCFMQGR